MECKNCKNSLSENDKFCNNCGAKVVNYRLTLRHMWSEFRDNFFNVDSTIFKTFLHMCTKPHVVIESYINGVRKRYFNVVSYYALALTFAGIQIFIIRKFYPEAMDFSFMAVTEGQQDTLDLDWTYDYYSLLALMNIPLYALMSKLTFIGLKKLNFTEHLATMTYIFAQFTLFSFPFTLTAVILGYNFYIVSYILFIPLFVYISYIFKKLYNLSLIGILLRCVLFFVVMVVMLIVAGILQVAVMMLTGEFKEMVEAQRQAQKVTSYMASSVMNWTS